MGIIYCAQNKVNGKRYIGQTRTSLACRRRGHENRALKMVDVQSPSVFILALRKYGVDSFEWTIVFDNVPNSDLDEYEVDAIFVYKTLVPNGYNLMTGGMSNGSHSEETRKKLSEATRNMSDETRNKMREAGRRRAPCSDESRKKMSEAGKRKGPISEETRKKMQEAQKQRTTRSEETKRKISEANKGKKKPPRSDEHRRKIREVHLGKKMPPCTEEHRKKLSEAITKVWARRRREFE